jgi:glutamate-5-semialdehyde dehydrogenase
MLTAVEYVTSLCKAANTAKSVLAAADTKCKNNVLERIAELLGEKSGEIIAANKADLDKAAENGVPKPMLDRLKLDDVRISGISSSLRDLVRLEDPIGSGTRTTRPNGLVIEHIRVPLGVVAIIYKLVRTSRSMPPRSALKQEMSVYCAEEKKL